MLNKIQREHTEQVPPLQKLLKIAAGTVLRRIRQIGKNVIKPPISLNQAVVEVDELRAFISQKENEYCVAYALCKFRRT
jgi:hypothetical protein